MSAVNRAEIKASLKYFSVWFKIIALLLILRDPVSHKKTPRGLSHLLLELSEVESCSGGLPKEAFSTSFIVLRRQTSGLVIGFAAQAVLVAGYLASIHFERCLIASDSMFFVKRTL